MAQTPEPKLSLFSDTRSRHRRKRSSGDFSIEEVFPDDMGYDADVEVIKPDKYEEAESESEDGGRAGYRRHTIDEELAARMRRLGRDTTPTIQEPIDRGRKRMSAEMADDHDTLFNVPLSPDIEIQEVVDTTAQPSPAKRRRKKSRRPYSTEQLLRGHSNTWTDSSDKGVGNDKASQDQSTSSTPSEPAVVANSRDDDEMMDIT